MPKVVTILPDNTKIWRDKTAGEILAEEIDKMNKPLPNREKFYNNE